MCSAVAFYACNSGLISFCCPPLSTGQFCCLCRSCLTSTDTTRGGYGGACGVHTEVYKQGGSPRLRDVPCVQQHCLHASHKQHGGSCASQQLSCCHFAYAYAVPLQQRAGCFIHLILCHKACTRVLISNCLHAGVLLHPTVKHCSVQAQTVDAVLLAAHAHCTG